MTSEEFPARAALSRLFTTTTRPYILLGLGVMSFVGMGAALRTTFRSIDLGIDRIAKVPLAVSLGLCLGYRVLNAYGWTLSVRALGQRIGGVVGIRIWMISESYRWIPGSVWGFGSRAVLAARYGVAPPIAAASVVLEVLLTVAGWILVALSGWFCLPGLLDVVRLNPTKTLVAGGIGMLAIAGLQLGWAWAVRGTESGASFDGFRGRARILKRVRPDVLGLTLALAFYTTMAILNGLVFVVVLAAMPGGVACPIPAAVAANSIAWLVGFFAVFAPSGLIVREGCLAALLTAWIPLPQAVMITLAWRSVQIISEICCAAGLFAHAAFRARPLAPGGLVRVSNEPESRDAIEALIDRESILLTEIGTSSARSPSPGGV